MADNFRPNAGIVVFNKEGKVLLCKRSDEDDAWQFPQGGIERGETASIAAQRELWEETSLKNVKLIKTLKEPAPYRFPPDVMALTKSRGWNYVGQKMYWSLFYFCGDDSEINLNTEGHEFSEYRWDTLESAYQLIVDFKKTAYATAVKAFTPLIKEYLQK